MSSIYSFDKKYQCDEVHGVCFAFEDQGQFEPLLLGSEGRITKITGGLMKATEEEGQWMCYKLDEWELEKFFVNLLDKKLLVDFCNKFEEIKKIIRKKREEVKK